MVRRRYRAEVAASTTMTSAASPRWRLRCGGSATASAPAQRFRIGLEFALSGFRDLDGMIAQHAALARSLATEIGLPAGFRRRSVRPTSAGTARAGRAGLPPRRSRSLPGWPSSPSISRWRIASAAPEARSGWPASARLAVRPELANLICADPSGMLGGLGTAAPGTAVIDAEPALSVTLSGTSWTPRCAASPISST